MHVCLLIGNLKKIYPFPINCNVCAVFAMLVDIRSWVNMWKKAELPLMIIAHNFKKGGFKDEVQF